MKIEVFAICYNEEVMLPFFLDHYEKFCDRITLYDNYSTDRSCKIIAGREKVSVVKWDSGNQVRDDLYLKIKNNCWKHSIADWVIICDIDELVWTFNPRVNLGLKDYTIIMPDWYEMVGNYLPSKTRWLPIEGVPHGQTSKCIMFRPQALQEINYHPGAHGVDPVGDARVLHTSEMGILHYKFLDPDYVITRHRLFGERLSDINKKYRWGVQYQFTEEQTRKGWEDLWNRRQRIL